MTDIKVSQDKYLLEWLTERILSVRWNSIKNCAQRSGWLIEEGEVEHWIK